MVAVMMAHGFEEIEALTVVDILRRASIDVKLVSADKERLVAGAHGIIVECDAIIDKVLSDRTEMVILPGGMPGTTNLMNNIKVMSFIKEMYANKKWVCAICAAPMILGVNGFLNGRRATCFPGFEQYLTGALVSANKVEVFGNIITSRGAGTASDFAFTIVSELKSVKEAEELKKKMLYE